MSGFARKWALVVCALALVLAGMKPAAANIIRIAGPTTVVNEAEGLIKLDAAFDTVNQVYLVVWGTQAPNLHGQFLNVNGQPLGPMFVIQSLAGWARVTYSPTYQKFMLGYTKITDIDPITWAVRQHGRFVRFVTFNGSNNTPIMGSEIQLDTFPSAGNATGVAFSTATGSFYATWYKAINGYPQSFVAAIDANGTVLSTYQLTTNATLGQSDPNIACNTSGRCLVVGWAWNNATWGRLIEGALGTPVGDMWDIAVAPNGQVLGDGTISYSALQDRFVVIYVRNFNTVWGKTVDADGGTSAAYTILESTPETAALVGPGYGIPNIVYNGGTSSFLVAARDYFSKADAQELDANGLPLFGSSDQLANLDSSSVSQYTITAADPANRRFLLLDNQNFNSWRVSVYELGDPQLLNGNFSNGTNNWFAWASPDMSNVVTNLSGGVYQFYKTVPSDGSNAAIVYQDTTMSFPSSTRLHAQFDLGNSSSVLKSVNVTLHTNFNDTKVCTFNLPANSPLRTYQMRAITSIGWPRASIVFEAVTPGSDGGYYLLDNVVLEAAPSQTNTGTECVNPPSGAPKADANGDGTSDILWQHTNGSAAIWLMNGLATSGSGPLIGAGTGWSVAESADFSGDGKSDILWRHTDGSTGMWLMNGATLTGGAGLIGPGTGWSFKRAGDFNGDGKKDILWQHTDGSTAMWLMNGLTLVTGAGMVGPGTGWSVAQVADFDGDGNSDILWQHTDGSSAIWLMNGVTLAGGGGLFGAGTGWSVKQVGDFNGDGKSDILWQHTDGTSAIWLMNGVSIVTGGGLLPAGTGWTAVQVGDFNGDGKGDIVWQHTDGSAVIWLMNGLSLTGSGGIRGAGTGWTVNQLADFNGDGKRDIVWVHTNGSSSLWLMNGYTPTAVGTLLGAGTGWSPIP